MTRYEKFASLFGENWLVGRALLPTLMSIGSRESGPVLDLACGESPFRVFFSGAESYIRVDRRPADSEVLEGDMTCIPLGENAVETVLLFQAISDVAHPALVLEEIRRVLRTGGKLVIFESMAYPEHDAPYDFYRIMPEGLRFLARETGYRFESVQRLGGLFARFATLWNCFVMGRLASNKYLAPLARLGIAGVNIVCYLLDRSFPHSTLAPDYIAVLQLDDPEEGASLAHVVER